MIESESVHFRQEITCHSSNRLCVDSEQVISSFVGFMFGYRQCKENYLLIVCFFYPDNASLILSREKYCLHTVFENKKKQKPFLLNCMLHSTYWKYAVYVLHKGASKCHHECLMCHLVKFNPWQIKNNLKWPNRKGTRTKNMSNQTFSKGTGGKRSHSTPLWVLF